MLQIPGLKLQTYTGAELLAQRDKSQGTTRKRPTMGRLGGGDQEDEGGHDGLVGRSIILTHDAHI